MIIYIYTIIYSLCNSPSLNVFVRFCSVGVVFVWQLMLMFPPRMLLKEVVGHTRGPPPSAAGMSWLGCGV